MTKEQEFYNRVEEEYDDFVQEVEEYGSQEVLCEADRIAQMQSIYEYLMDFRPIDEEHYAEFLEVENPLETIYRRYNPSLEEYHEELCGVVEDLTKEYRVQKQREAQPQPESVLELTWEIFKEKEEYEHILADRIDRNAWDNVTANVGTGRYHFSEYDAKILLQFKEPIFVLVKEIGSTDEPFHKQVERMMDNLGRVDLLTYQHELNYDNILPETIQRHDAIITLMDKIPAFNFHTAAEWLSLNRFINEEMVYKGENPYTEFLDVMNGIKERHGDEILQKIFDMGNEFVVQSEELVEIASYLADGGDIHDVPDLAAEDYFLIPYEQHKQEQGGMDLC